MPTSRIRIDKSKVFFQAPGRNFTILTYGQQDLDLEAAAQSAGMEQLLIPRDGFRNQS